MLKPRCLVSTFVKCMFMLSCGTACAQSYPGKLIRIHTTSAGSGNDFIARLISNGVSGPLGQAIVVENQRNPILAAESAAKASPDGYTLMVHGGTVWILPLLQKLSYDVVRDFLPIALISRDVSIVAVHPSIPAKSIKELVALAKARPGEINFSVANPGGTANLATALFKSMTGINIVHVPYGGNPPAVTAVLGGEVHAAIMDAGLLKPHIASGKLRALAVTSAEPSVLVPGLPTLAATVPGYEHVGMTGVWAPTKTPAAIITRLNQEIVRYFNTAEARERILSAGAEVVASNPEQFATIIKADIVRKSKLIQEVGITVQ